MNALKKRNMMAAYDGFTGTQTLAAVMDQVPEELWGRLTGHELGLVMSAINRAYHKGKADAGAEVVDDCIWIDGKLLPLAAIEAIQVTETVEHCPCEPSHVNPNPRPDAMEQWTIRHYKLDYKERF